MDKSQKIGNGTFGNCYVALYGNEYRVVAKEMKIIETSKKTREEVWREASAITGIGDHWGIPLLFGVFTDRAPFYPVLQFHALRSESVTLFKAASEKVIQDVAVCVNILKQTWETLMFIHERDFLRNDLKSNNVVIDGSENKPVRGADPGFFFKRGCPRLLLYFKTNKPHSFFLGGGGCRIPVVLENRRSSQEGCAPPATSP